MGRGGVEGNRGGVADTYKEMTENLSIKGLEKGASKQWTGD